ncbi:hypothetical protein [Roseovarius sp. SYSU LYC5161]|jgi:hypothetical protein|nr:hypothetical protein [Roseovarius sp.]
MKLFKISAVLFMGAFVAACAQQQEEPVVVVEPEPVYDKYGNVVE